VDGRRLVYRFSSEGVDIHPGRDGYRLPTEAEWEYAASRGPAPTRGTTEIGVELYNFYRSDDSYEDPQPPYTAAGGPTSPVGSLNNASDDGIFDLLGNVWEWCNDWYDAEWYQTLSERGGTANPDGPPEPVTDRFDVVSRVVRGAAWNSREGEVRVANRGRFPPHQTSHSIGVRLVRTAGGE
jgi:formylglycine-generating enzyme required for sulfatase activity